MCEWCRVGTVDGNKGVPLVSNLRAAAPRGLLEARDAPSTLVASSGHLLMRGGGGRADEPLADADR